MFPCIGDYDLIQGFSELSWESRLRKHRRNKIECGILRLFTNKPSFHLVFSLWIFVFHGAEGLSSISWNFQGTPHFFDKNDLFKWWKYVRDIGINTFKVFCATFGVIFRIFPNIIFSWVGYVLPHPPRIRQFILEWYFLFQIQF